MSRINVVKINNYNNIVVIDKDSGDGESIYSRFINSLKRINIINTDYNKIKFMKSDVCIVYNINDMNEDYESVMKFKDINNDKMKKNNVDLILLNKEDNKIYKIGDVIVCHSLIIKRLMNLSYFTDIINDLVDNDKFKINMKFYVNEIIRELLINITNEGKLNGKCFNMIKDKIKWFIEKDSEHENKNNSISYLDKTVIVLDYKAEHKTFNRINNEDRIYEIK